MDRRKFIKQTALTGAGLTLPNTLVSCNDNNNDASEVETNTIVNTKNVPLVIATWHVKEATAKAMQVLQAGGNALDAVEQGCRERRSE